MVLLMAGLGVGCGTTERLAEGEVLYTGAEIELVDEAEVDAPERVRYALGEYAEPEPNSSVLGMRPTLWVHQKFGQKKPDGLGAKIQDRLGEPPVLLNEERARRNVLFMEKYLRDEGYLSNQVTYRVDYEEEGHEARVIYQVKARPRYRLSEVVFPEPSDPARRSIHRSQAGSQLKEGEPYRLENLQQERQRLTRLLRNQGYADFGPSYLFYALDSASGDHQVRLQMQVQAPSDSTQHHPYFLRNVRVYPDFSLDQSQNSSTQPGGILAYEHLNFMGQQPTLRPEVLARNILLKPGDPYREDDYRYTLQHLQDLGVYKFVNIKFRPDPDTIQTDSLVAAIYLTPRKQQELGLDLEADTRTGLFSGYGASLSGNYSHLNFFRGAERFRASLNGSAVLQPGDTTSLINTLDIGAQVDLYVPRLLLPFAIDESKQFHLPQTRFSASYSYQDRIGFYTLGSLGLSFGYQWDGNEERTQQHELTPISALGIDLLSSSGDFDSLLRSNPFLQSSFSDVLIVGPQYTFTLQQKPRAILQAYHFFQANIESSGNLLWLGYRAAQGPRNGEAYRLFRRPFAQYVRSELEYRNYFPIAKEQKLAFRVVVGGGYALGNSQVLPYLKQFFVGGPISLRAFGLRQLGPGTFQSGERQDEIGFVDQTGDLVLESTLEYRFGIYEYLKGAVFLDAGNVWLMPGTEPDNLGPREAVRYEQGLFRPQDFVSELAVGGGLGLRLDVDFFVLRLDLATPLREPYFPEGDRWSFSRMNWFDLDWLRDRRNLRLNVAIGYPF